MKIITIRSLVTDKFCPGIFTVVLLFFLNVFCASSQDLYDLSHSKQYAEYLTSSHQYRLAAEEYERLVFLDSSNATFKYDLVKSYRLSGDFSKAINRVYSLYGSSGSNMPSSIATEFLKLEILTDSLSVVDRFTMLNSTLPERERVSYKCIRLLLIGNYEEAREIAGDAVGKFQGFPKGIVDLANEADKVKFKSPFVAGVFSTVVPGTGKFYTKDWADGVFSMIFVAGSAWQAYRGFKKHGSGSAYGWTFATVSASFYLGNIYGSVKAARRYNKTRRDEINKQVFVFVNSDSY